MGMPIQRKLEILWTWPVWYEELRSEKSGFWNSTLAGVALLGSTVLRQKQCVKGFRKLTLKLVKYLESTPFCDGSLSKRSCILRARNSPAFGWAVGGRSEDGVSLEPYSQVEGASYFENTPMTITWA